MFDSTGSFTAQTTQNEIITDRNVSISFADDMVYISADGNVGVEINKNTLTAMLEGNSFTDGSSIIKVVGTNGTRLVEPAESGQAFKSFMLQDGKLIRPQSDNGIGRPELVANTYVAGYNNYAVCVILEFLQSFDSNTRTGYLIPYVLGSGTQFSENSDYNKFSVECQILSDVRNIDSFLVDGLSEADNIVGATGSEEFYKINNTSLGGATANVYFVSCDTTDGLPSAIDLINGTAGDLLCMVGEGQWASDQNNIDIWEITGATTADFLFSASSALRTGGNVFIDRRLTQDVETVLGNVQLVGGGDIDMDSFTESKGIVNCTNNNGLGNVSALNVQVGNGADKYILDIKDYNFSNQTWETL